MYTSPYLLPSGLLSGSPHTSPNTSLSTVLQVAHQRISRLMVEQGCRDHPVNLCYVEPLMHKLIIGIPHLTPQTVRDYQRFLQDVVKEVAWKDVPVQFRQCQFVRHANKQNYNRPLIGGLSIQCPDVGGVGTICIVCSRGGVTGFVTCGHVVASPGIRVYQPQPSSQNNWLVGTSTIVSNYRHAALSDSAFIAASGGVDLAPNQIWQSSQAVYNIIGHYDAPQLGTAVSMQGASTQTAERSGVIAGKNVTVTFGDRATLQNQLLANYLSQEGDSGAPVYFKMGGNQVLLVGLNVGATQPRYADPEPDARQYPPASNDMYAIISPWTNVEQDLGLQVLAPHAAPDLTP